MKKSKQQIRSSKYGISAIHMTPDVKYKFDNIKYVSIAIRFLKEQSELFDELSNAGQKTLQDALQKNPSTSECDVILASLVQDLQEASAYCMKSYELLTKYM